VTVLFGGIGVAPNTIDETWLFDGRLWRRAQTDISPPPRIHGAMAYHPGVSRTLLIGGRTQTPGPLDYPLDAWVWDGVTWTKLEGAPKLHFPLASYDEARHVVVVFGWGPASLPETWTWDGVAWVSKPSQQSPSVASQAGMCFDRSTQKTVLYGGVSVIIAGGASSETWLWDGAAWSQAHPAHVPGPRFEHALICGGQTILFGGVTNQQGTVATETWRWDGADWHKMDPAHKPPVCCGAVAYDGDRMMLFETSSDGIPVWTWTGSDWTQ
jgi:hypothetical protein